MPGRARHDKRNNRVTGDVFVELRRIRKEFGAFTALQGIDLGIRKGEFVCFLGPSGCGKTTLLRIIAGLETQTAGEVWQGGRDISLLPPAQRDYGIVFQSYALFPNLSVADNVSYGLVNRKTPRAEINKRVSELVKLVGLPGSEGKYPGQLSGGQQQRIALARALATSPGLLLLDEPLSALDALERLRLRGEIRALQQRLGVTTIMVTHDQEEALSMADHIVVMSRGHIEQVGTPQQIYREPATAFVADFVGKVNVISAIAQGEGRVRVGELLLNGALGSEGLAPGTPVKLYLRPEDVMINGQASDQANVASASVQKIEFLGAFCLVTVMLADAPAQPIVVNLSRHSLDRMALAIGAPLSVGLPRECMRLL